MLKKTIEQRQAYHDRKAKELDEIADPHMYTRRLARIMKYHKLLSELESAKVKENLRGVVKQMEQKQDVAIKNEGEKEMGKTNNAVRQLVLEMTDGVGSLGCLVEDLGHVRNVLGRLAEDAKDKEFNKMGAYFLWDNNDTLQTIDNLMFRLVKEIEEDYKRIDDIKEELHGLTIVRELDIKKA